MRALLVTNSFATTTNPELAAAITDELARFFTLTTRATSSREDAMTFAAQATTDDFDLVISLGGDGTANEVINGLLKVDPTKRPAFASLPGGNANVLSRNLGFSRKSLTAARELIDVVKKSLPTSIGIGHVAATGESTEISRYFAVNAGVGIDAEVLLSMHELRNRGKKVSDLAYARLALRRIFQWMNKRTPQLVIDGQHYFFAFILNLSPWTYVSDKAINPAVSVTQQTALSAYAAASTDVRSFISVLRALALGKQFADISSMRAFENRAEISITALSPLWLQVDGEPLAVISQATFTHHPDVLKIYQASEKENPKPRI